jgi:hypothetical protein
LANLSRDAAPAALRPSLIRPPVLGAKALQGAGPILKS